MKNLFIAICTAVLICSCSSDDDHRPTQNYDAFLATDRPLFQGELNSSPFRWQFDVGTYQGIWGFNPVDFIPDNPNRILFSGLNAEDGNSGVMLTVPAYDTSSDEEFESVFGVGKKHLGQMGDKFHLRIRKGDLYYNTCDYDNKKRLEILKTEEHLTPEGPVLWVWVKIDDIRLDNCSGSEGNKLDDGLIFLKFQGHKSAPTGKHLASPMKK